MSVPQSVAFFYPKMISIHEFPAEVGTTLLNGRIKLPSMIRSSIDRLNPAGIYIVGKTFLKFIPLENGINMMMWVGRNTSPELLTQLFNVPKPEQIDIKMVILPSSNWNSENFLNLKMSSLKRHD
jgi:protein transport protein SEC24